MKPLRGFAAAVVPVALMLLTCGFGTERGRTLKSPMIVTATPAYDSQAALRGEERFPKGARLLLVKAGVSKPLVEGFAATADANVSFDATHVLFAGKKQMSDPWAIWELSLSDSSVRSVIRGATDAIKPMYLPGGRLVYARKGMHGFQLEAAEMDGSGALPLSYAQANAVPDDVLADGRILFETGFPVREGNTPELMLVYSDGSGVESYRCDHGAARWGGKQVSSGDVVFTHGGSLGRFTSALAEEMKVDVPAAEYAGAIAELPTDDWLVSVRTNAAARYGVGLWRAGEPSTQDVFSRTDEDVVQPVVLAPRARPRKHPSALHDWDYANLLALDARQSRDGDLNAVPAAVRLETQEEDGSARVLGTAPVESDGSFFVKAPADRPLRFALLNEQGRVIRQERGWFWMRKGEQRICVGCHAGPEHAAENRVPEVLLHTTTPVDLTGHANASALGGH